MQMYLLNILYQFYVIPIKVGHNYLWQYNLSLKRVVIKFTYWLLTYTQEIKLSLVKLPDKVAWKVKSRTPHRFLGGNIEKSILLSYVQMKFKSLIFIFSFIFFPLLSDVSLTAEIAVIKTRDIEPYQVALAGFKGVLNVSIVEYNMDGDMDKGHEIAKEINANAPDLILAIGTKAAIVAHQDIKNIPMVFVMVSRPEVYGLINDNITGVSLNISSYDQFKVLKSLFPGIKRIGVIYNPKITGKTVAAAAEDARRLDLELIAQGVHSGGDIPKAVRRLEGSIDALWMTMDETIVESYALKHIMLFTLRNKVPFMGLSIRFVQEGALFALSCDYQDLGRQAGELANQILGGKSPRNLSIISPRKKMLVLNLKTAKIIGVNFPSEVTANAAKIYE